ncbi:MAG: trimethylamine methyltransferase family protein [Eubacteriales bacterium]|jgi:trimethylamine--corrinoid protein Co-methyltransferase
MRLRNDLYDMRDVEKIHAASVTLLERKGVHMPSQMALDIFRKAGARVEGEIVYIAEAMLDEALKHCPPSFRMLARKPEHDVVIGGGKPCFCLPNGPIFIKKGEEYWSSQSQDVINFMKLAENSPTINMVSPWVTTANDVEPAKQLTYQLAVTLKYCTKPIMGLTAGYEKSKFSIQLVRDFYDKHEDGQYVCLGLISPISPLSYDDKMLEAIVAYAEENQPLFFSSAVLPGATGPVTLAGALALANAEMLAGIVLAQLVHPGVPILYGNAAGSADLRFVTPAIGAPEAGLTAIYVRGLADKYHMPCRSGGALCDSKLVDAQAGIEATMVMLPTLLAGTDFILHGAGILDSYNIISYDKFLMDEEMTKMCLFMKEGVTVNEDTLALDTIMAVPHGDQYLMEDHTFEHMRTALYTPQYLEKGYYDMWQKAGAHTAAGNALRAVDKRLEEYQETPLTPYQEQLISQYLNI